MGNKILLGALRWSIPFIATIMLTSCSPKIVTEMPLPQREIVFQGGLSGYHPLGFINGDGSGLIYVNLRGILIPQWPTWTTDGRYLLFHYRERFCLGTISAEGKLHLWPRIGLIGHAAPIPGTHKAILVVDGGEKSQYDYIYEVDVETGKNLRTWAASANSWLKVGTNAMHNGQLVYVHMWDDKSGIRRSELILLDKETGEKRVILRIDGEIRSPAFSPTGEWIAYTGYDGIYLVRPDGSENHRILEERWYESYPTKFAPAASWSPDGACVVYHRCVCTIKEMCETQGECFAIFKLNLKTLEEQFLVRGGIYPYWRLIKRTEDQH